MGVLQSVILEDTTCTHKSLLDHANLCWHKSSKYVREWNLRLLGQQDQYNVGSDQIHCLKYTFLRI